MAHPDDFEVGILQDFGLYLGVVTNNKDPLKRNRCRVRIPGLYEPESDWAWPLYPGAGSVGQGIRAPYAKGSFVAVIAEQGDLMRLFILGGVTVPDEEDEISALPVAEVPNVLSIKMGRFSVVINKNENAPAIYFRDEGTTDPNASAAERDPCSIFIDGATRAVTIKGQRAVNLEAVGRVVLDGVRVELAGRTVLRNRRPI